MPFGSLSRRDVLRGTGASVAAAALAPLWTSCSSAPPPANLSYSVETISYGVEPLQVGVLNVPLVSTARPVVVLVHGGYWRVGFTRDEMNDLANDLSHAGYASWNIDYRRVGDPNGGYPGTLQDIADAVDKLDAIAGEHKLDLNRVAFVGHSAGAELAIWAAMRDRLKTPPGTTPKVRPKAIVSLAGALDLKASGSSTKPELDDSIVKFLGGTAAQQPNRYAATSPTALLPLGLPQLLLHGTKDDRIPIEQSRAYKGAAEAAGDKVKLIELDGIDHFDVVKSQRSWWTETLAWLASVLGDPTH